MQTRAEVVFTLLLCIYVFHGNYLITFLNWQNKFRLHKNYVFMDLD